VFSVISFQFSVEANMRPALYCAAGTNHTDPLSKSVSRSLNLFDQAKQHPFDLGDPGIQNCGLLVGKQVQVSSKKNVALQFAGRPKRNEEKLPKFRIGRPGTTFGEACRDRSCTTPDLAGQPEQSLICKEAGNRIQAQRHSVTFPPDEQRGEILHERLSREEVYCIYLESNTDNCKLLRSGYVH
jgi:hypothetical protein